MECMRIDDDASESNKKEEKESARPTTRL